jgi:hypothetical protein
MRLLKRANAVAAAAVLAVLASLLVAAPAQAATCHAASCTGKDPNAAGCAALTLETRASEGATVELRYSPDASCRAFWARIKVPREGWIIGFAAISVDRMVDYNGLTRSISAEVQPGHSGYTRMWAREAGFSYRACVSYPAAGISARCTVWVTG